MQEVAANSHLLALSICFRTNTERKIICKALKPALGDFVSIPANGWKWHYENEPKTTFA
jgi:hypothetical protein